MASAPALALAAGIDIGGTRTKLALVDDQGGVSRLLTLSTPARDDPASFLDELRRQVEDLRRAFPLRGVGLCVAGFLADDMRSVRYTPNLPALQGFDFAGWLQGFGLPYRLEQDLNAAALAEYYFGEYRLAPRLLVAAIGTGLSAGFILDGQVLRFLGGTIGDPGHIILEPGGPLCTAGCHGCAEALVSGPGLERLALERRGTALPAREIIAAARRGEPWAVELITIIAAWLGQWLASLAPIFGPSHILLAGGLVESGDLLLRLAEARLRQLTGPEYARCRLGISRFGGLAGLIGAAAPLLV